MAKTVVGYFRNQHQAERLVTQLLEHGYEAEFINLIYKDLKAKTDEDEIYDNTIEASPVAEYKEAMFGADVTEDDADYYQAEVDKGNVLIAVYVPTDASRGRLWEAEVSDSLGDQMRDNGAYDREVRPIYSNRGMTTYPQNRYMDPAAGVNPKDRIYRSASPLNQEQSNVIGVNDHYSGESMDEVRGGREVVSGASLVSQFASAEAELLQKAREKNQS